MRVNNIRTCSVHNKALQAEDSATTSYSEEDMNSFYNDVDTLGKPNHYTMVIGDFNAQIWNRTNPMETATGTFGVELRNERHLGRMGNIKKLENHEHRVS